MREALHLRLCHRVVFLAGGDITFYDAERAAERRDERTRAVESLCGVASVPRFDDDDDRRMFVLTTKYCFSANGTDDDDAVASLANDIEITLHTSSRRARTGKRRARAFCGRVFISIRSLGAS